MSLSTVSGRNQQRPRSSSKANTEIRNRISTLAVVYSDKSLDEVVSMLSDEGYDVNAHPRGTLWWWMRCARRNSPRIARETRKVLDRLVAEERARIEQCSDENNNGSFHGSYTKDATTVSLTKDNVWEAIVAAVKEIHQLRADNQKLKKIETYYKSAVRDYIELSKRYDILKEKYDALERQYAKLKDDTRTLSYTFNTKNVYGEKSLNDS